MVTYTVRLRAMRNTKEKTYLGRLTSSHNKLWALVITSNSDILLRLILELLGFPPRSSGKFLLPQQILKFPSNLFTHFDEPNNSLELPKGRYVFNWEGWAGVF